MKPLATTFRSDGFDFTMLKRKGDVALFKKQKPGHVNPIYELVIVQKAKEEAIYGKSYPEREKMPSNEDWGTFGWTLPSLETAQARFAALDSAPNSPNSP